MQTINYPINTLFGGPRSVFGGLILFRIYFSTAVDHLHEKKASPIHPSNLKLLKVGNVGGGGGGPPSSSPRLNRQIKHD